MTFYSYVGTPRHATHKRHSRDSRYRASLPWAFMLGGEWSTHDWLKKPVSTFLQKHRAVSPQYMHVSLRQSRSGLKIRTKIRDKEEVCRHFGHGYLDNTLMQESPEAGVTMIGLGSIRKDGAQIFKMPVPPSLSGEKLPRSMRVTLAWFSPVNPSRAQYRLAALEAAALNGTADDDRWGFDMTPEYLDENIIKRGSVWSKRMKNRVQAIPEFKEDTDIPIRVQCRDASNGGLNPDEDIMFAIVVTLQVEAEVEFDIHQEVDQALRIRLAQR